MHTWVLYNSLSKVNRTWSRVIHTIDSGAAEIVAALLADPTQAFQFANPLTPHVVEIDLPVPVAMVTPLRVIVTTTAPRRPLKGTLPWYNPAPFPSGTLVHFAAEEVPPMLTETSAIEPRTAVKKTLSSSTCVTGNSTCNCDAVLPEVLPSLQAAPGWMRYLRKQY